MIKQINESLIKERLGYADIHKSLSRPKNKQLSKNTWKERGKQKLKKTEYNT